MMNILYEDVFLAVKQWIDEKKDDWIKREILADIVIKDTIVVDFDFKMCIARIVVEDSEFSPYRYVSLEVLHLKSGELIYYWYDNDASIDTILLELDKGVQFCISFT
jgi:hypothetical protein